MSKLDTILTRGVAEIIQDVTLKNKLEGGKKLVVKLGIDPTNKNLHIGHYLVLQKLRDFQDAGHDAVLVIGDFTARIGDPSGKSTKRAALSKEEIGENMKEYANQAGKIVDLKKAKIVYNSTWFDKLGVAGVIELVSKATFSQIMERKEFKTRLEKDELSLLEFFYPLMQAYDSVMLKADVEIGGLDQKLNLLMGRQIQKRYNQKQQDIVLTPLLVGLDGKEKMSKTAGNYVAINDIPADMFGKIMSIPDSLVKDYFIYTTRLPIEKINFLLKEGGMPPIEIKKTLATEITKIYHGETLAQKAKNEFERVFQKKERTSNIDEKTLSLSEVNFPLSYASFAYVSGGTVSVSEAIRLAENRGLKINGELITEPRALINEPPENGTILDIGKRRSIRINWKD